MFLVVLALLGAGAAWLTRPHMADFDALLRNAIQKRIATTDIGTGGDAMSTIALVGCKLRPSDCFDLIRKGLDVTETDKTLFTRFTVKGMKQEVQCTGAFTKIWCGKDLLQE